MFEFKKKDNLAPALWIAVMMAVVMAICVISPMSEPVYGQTAGADGGSIASNSKTDAEAAFGASNATVTYSENTLTITLDQDVELGAPVRFVKGTAADRIVLDLNGHELTGRPGVSGTDEAAAEGGNAIELIADEFDLEIKGPGSVIGGKGAVYETDEPFRLGKDGGMAICFARNEDGTYWYPGANDARLDHGLLVSGGAVITGGEGADISGEDWLFNIEKRAEDGGHGLVDYHFALTAGPGGAGIGQTDTGEEYGFRASTLSYARIVIEDGKVIGGSGGNVELTGSGMPAMTHYGLMNNSSIDQFLRALPTNGASYNNYFSSNIKFNNGPGADGIMIGAGRKYLCVEEQAEVTGGPCGTVEYGGSRLVNQISSNSIYEAGNGISVFGDIGLTNANMEDPDENWSSGKGRDSDEMGIYIAGTVKGGDSPDADARRESACSGGNGIVLHGDEDYVRKDWKNRLDFPRGEDFINWGIVDIDTDGKVCGGNGGNAVYSGAGRGGEGIWEAYTKGDGPSDSLIGTDYYIVNGIVAGGSGGNSLGLASSSSGGTGMSFGNYRKDANIAGSGTVSGGDSGSAVDRGNGGDPGTQASAIRFYPPDPESYNNTVTGVTETEGKSPDPIPVDNSGLSVKANMTSFDSYPTNKTKLSCTVTKPAGYSGAVFVTWTAKLTLQINPSEVFDIEPGGTDATSFFLRSNSDYKYLAYPTYEDRPELGNNYNEDVVTTDRIIETIKYNNSKAEIWCDVLLEDGRWARSNVMKFTKDGWDGGSGGDPQQDETALKAAARDVASRIDQLYSSDAGELMLRDAATVAAVRSDYDALIAAGNPYAQVYIDDVLYQKLETAEMRIADLVSADEVTQQIAELVVLLKDTKAEEGKTDEEIAAAKETAGLAIADARDEYDALTDTQKQLVPNVQTLTDAEALMQVPEEEYQTALSEFIERNDLIDLSAAEITAPDVTYNGTEQTPPVKVTLGGKELTEDVDYQVKYDRNIDAGEAEVIVTGKGLYTGQASGKFTIKKAANPLNVKGKTIKVKYKKAKKKAQKYAVSKGISFRNKGHGKLSYVKKSGKKAVTVNKKTGKITVKKKTKKGTYRIKVKVTAAGGANHNAGSKIVTVIVKVK